MIIDYYIKHKYEPWLGISFDYYDKEVLARIGEEYQYRFEINICIIYFGLMVLIK